MSTNHNPERRPLLDGPSKFFVVLGCAVILSSLALLIGRS